MHPTVIAFQTCLVNDFAELERKNLGREGLIAMAHFLQKELACDMQGKICRHSQDLELLMRSIIATLDDQSDKFPDWKKYILENLLPGTAGLVRALGFMVQDVFRGYP